MFNDGINQSIRLEKIWGINHDFSFHYAIKNDQYSKTLQEAVNVMRGVKFKANNNNDKSKKKTELKWRW